MSYETTEQILAIQNVDRLTETIRWRIRGEYGDPPTGMDWTWTEAVSRANSIVRRTNREATFIQAVLSLLNDLSLDTQGGRGPEEWPAGLLRITTQIVWSGEARMTAGRAIARLLSDAYISPWPIGKPTAPSLGSATLELHRAARLLLPFDSHDFALSPSIERLVATDSTEADKELGALIGIMASYDGKAVAAMRFLASVRGLRWDRVYDAIDMEYQPLARWAPSLP